MSAYDHSFLPSGSGSYIIQLLESGWTYAAAQNQARIEHGEEQVDEIVSLARQVVEERGWTTAGPIPALRLAIRRAEKIEASRQL